MSEQSSARQWSSRSLGSRFQHQIFYQLVRWRLMPLAHALLRAVVFYYTLLPWVRRRCLPYVRRRFGLPAQGQGWHSFLHAYRLYLSFGQVLLDRMVAGATGRFAITPAMTEARALLCQVLARGQGCIVLSAHVGAWQLGLAALEVTGVPVNMLQWRDPEDVDRHYFEAGQGQPVRIIDASRPVEAMVHAAAALRRGEVLAVMGDRLTQDGSPPASQNAARNSAHNNAAKSEGRVELDFLGGRIALPITPYALSSITGAPLVMVFTVRAQGKTQPFLAQEISVPRGLNHRDPQAFLPHAGAFVQALEALTAAHPYQFFNFYNLWLDTHEHH